MRNDIAEALRSLTVDELLSARRLIDSLLAGLKQQARSQRMPSDDLSERRRFGRYSINLHVTYFRHSSQSTAGPGGEPVQDAVVRDISRGGLRFFSNEALAEGELLTVYLPGPLGVRKLFVEVTRTHKRSDQFECGASFVGLDRVFAAQRVEEERSEAVQVLIVCEPCTERQALTEILVKQGYVAHVANSVPEASSMLELHRCALVLASAPMLLAENARLLDELMTKEGDILSIAIVSASDIDGADFERLRQCHDFLSEPDKAQEVRVVVGRTYRRLTAMRQRNV